MRRFYIPSVVLLSVVLSACGAVPHQRQAANPLDARLLEVMRERTRLWQLPKVDGGTREIDVSALVCPLVTSESLGELFKVNDENVDFVPRSEIPPGSRLWRIKGDVIDPITVSMLGVRLGPDDRCEAQFRLTL